MKKIELLAPAGNYEVALAAINAGADAIYLGGELFGARANADNLTIEEIIDILDYAHLNKRKVYLTINTLFKNREIENNLFDFLCPLYEKGLDAVIVQDMGVLLYVKKNFPGLHIHASTQMTISGEYTVRELKELGVTRIVTPRELSLDEIKAIKSVGLEVESFVHGALCYCYSGQCYLSSFIGARSGNRGRCAQPCRLPYDVIYKNQVLNPGNAKYVLSPKDICTINILPELFDAGIDSLKIEGRMKKKEYVAGVVSIYRKFLDKGHIDDNDYQLLLDLFNRNGFNESYYKQHNGKNMISLKEPSFRLENREWVNHLNNSYSGKILKTKIDIKVTFKENQPLSIKLMDEQLNVEYKGETPDLAQNKPVGKDFLTKQIRKTNNTDFIIGNIEFDMDKNLFMTIKDINNARREFIELLKKELLKSYKKNISTIRDNDSVEFFDSSNISGEKENYATYISVLVNNYNQLKLCVDAVSNNPLIKRVYIDLDGFKTNDLIDAIYYCRDEDVEVFLALPRVARKSDILAINNDYAKAIELSDGCLVRNIEQYLYMKDKYDKQFAFDSNINIMNRYALSYYKTMGEVTASLELNERELSDMSFDELIVYGKAPVMTSANCCLKTMDYCNHNSEAYYLSDRMNNNFLVKCNCRHCYNVMYNCNPMSLFKFGQNILKNNYSFVRLSFVDESNGEVQNILKMAKDCFVYQKKVVDPNNTTRGHYSRGVI